jgi:hypothetical protein
LEFHADIGRPITVRREGEDYRAKFGLILSAMASRIAILLIGLGFTHAVNSACNPMTEVLEVGDLIALEPARMIRAPGTAIDRTFTVFVTAPRTYRGRKFSGLSLTDQEKGSNQIFVYLEHAVRGDEIKASFVLHQSKVEDISLELMYIADDKQCSIKSRLELKDSPEIRNYLGWQLEPDRPAAK